MAMISLKSLLDCDRLKGITYRSMRCFMASITIRNIDDGLKEKLRIRAAKQGHSMEEEARVILKRAINGISGPELLDVSTQLFGREHGVELDIPARTEDRATPDFGGAHS